MKVLCGRSQMLRMDAEKKQSKNFALQNSCQESTNPRMDLWFHVFGNAN